MPKKLSYLIFLTLIIASGFIFLLLRKKTIAPTAPIITITATSNLIDGLLEISISNLQPHEQITLQLSSYSQAGEQWLARANFKADENGIVNVAKQAPIEGSYQGIEPMGLFWSRAPINQSPAFNYFAINDDHCKTVLSVITQGTVRTQKTIYRYSSSPDIASQEICEDGIVGTLFYPITGKQGPGIIIIPGSTGTIVPSRAQLLACHGYTVLALGYFGMPGLPEKRSQIPLEYFQHAMQWLKKEVKGNKIALMGQSTGAEIALLLASLFPGEMDAVIAYSPTHLVYGDYAPEKKSAWTYQGKPIHFMPFPSGNAVYTANQSGEITPHKGTFEDPYQGFQIYLFGMKIFSTHLEETTIPVEKIRCPLLLLCGTDDKMWPSCVAANRIMERLDAFGSRIKRKQLVFPDAGNHLFLPPYGAAIDLPVHTDSGWLAVGGTIEGNAHARQQAWQEMLKFLDETLSQ